MAKIKDPILGNFAILIQEEQYVLIEEGKDKFGKDKETVYGYFSYGNFGGLLKKFIQIKAGRSEKVMNLKQYLDTYSKLTQSLTNVLEPKRNE